MRIKYLNADTVEFSTTNPECIGFRYEGNVIPIAETLEDGTKTAIIGGVQVADIRNVSAEEVFPEPEEEVQA